MLDVLSSTTPRPSGRKPHWARHLTDLTTKAGEKYGLNLCRAFGALPHAEIEAPLESRLADLPGAVSDDAVEQHAAVVFAHISLFVCELQQLSLSASDTWS